MECLVTGAAGFVGSHLTAALVLGGHSTHCLIRRTSSLSWLKGLPVRLHHGDVTDPDSLRSALVGIECVFHLAGTPRALRESDYFSVNAEGTRNLFQSCLDVSDRLRRVVVVSSLSAMGPGVIGQPLCEDDACHPITPYGRSKLQAERIAAEYHQQLPITVVRPPVIYGPRDRDGFQLFKLIDRGIRPLTLGPRVFSLIDARDLSEGLITAAEHPSAVGRTYHMANPEPETLDRLTDLIARALGRHPITVRLPTAAFYLSAGVQELAGQISRRPRTFDRFKAREMAQPYWVCDTRQAQSELGFAPRIPLEQGIRDAVEWYRGNGWL